jgi:L-ectoine synthase
MFVKTLTELKANGEEAIHGDGSLRAVRFLKKLDGMGFSVSDVRCTAGLDEVLWYKHHWEANYILHGHGIVSDLTSGEFWSLEPGTMYIVGPDDRHSIEAVSDLHLVSIFNPPLIGDEQHDEEGTLPSSGPLPPGMRGISAD